MASQKTIEKDFDFIMKEMFLRVGENYPNENLTSNSQWYTMRNWTDKDQKDFYNWMTSYLRKELKWTKTQSDKETAWFLLQYGWTTTNEIKIKSINNS